MRICSLPAPPIIAFKSAQLTAPMPAVEIHNDQNEFEKEETHRRSLSLSHGSRRGWCSPVRRDLQTAAPVELHQTAARGAAYSVQLANLPHRFHRDAQELGVAGPSGFGSDRFPHAAGRTIV